MRRNGWPGIYRNGWPTSTGIRGRHGPEYAGRLAKSSGRLLSAYQDGLATLEQLRQRMPELQKQARAVAAELHALEAAAVDDTRYLQLAETLAGFRTKLRVRAETLDVRERQQILRLIVNERCWLIATRSRSGIRFLSARPMPDRIACRRLAHLPQFAGVKYSFPGSYVKSRHYILVRGTSSGRIRSRCGRSNPSRSRRAD